MEFIITESEVLENAKRWKLRTLVFYATALAGCLAGQDLPKFGIGFKASTLGLGVEAATAVTSRSNVRAGFNGFNYSRDFTKDGIDYSGTLTLRSFEILYDQYLIGGFHVSPGLLVYNGNRGDAGASVPGGNLFTLGGTTFQSGRTDPVSGTGTLQLRKAAPIILMGFGNLLPRNSRHFAVNFEFGVAFQGSPDVKLNLRGSNVDTNPDIQSRVQAEQSKIVNDSSALLRFYPVVSLGFGYKF